MPAASGIVAAATPKPTPTAATTSPATPIMASRLHLNTVMSNLLLFAPATAPPAAARLCAEDADAAATHALVDAAHAGRIATRRRAGKGAPDGRGAARRAAAGAVDGGALEVGAA